MKSCLQNLLVLELLAAATTAPAQSYTITDLGAVPGQNVSASYGLNAFAQAVGVSSSPCSYILCDARNSSGIKRAVLLTPN